jgi:hypothetical protein
MTFPAGCGSNRMLLPLAASGDLSSADARGVSAHLQACPACRAELEVWRQQQRLFADVRETPTPLEGRESLWSKLEGRIQDRLPEAARPAEVRPRMPLHSRLTFSINGLLSLAVAALLGVAVWNELAALRNPEARSGRPGGINVAARPTANPGGAEFVAHQSGDPHVPSRPNDADGGFDDQRIEHFLGIIWSEGRPGSGVNVVGVMPGSPAELARIRSGDRIIGLDGVPVGVPADLARLILHPPSDGQRRRIEVARDGLAISLPIMLRPRVTRPSRKQIRPLEFSPGIEIPESDQSRAAPPAHRGGLEPNRHEGHTDRPEDTIDSTTLVFERFPTASDSPPLL